MPLNSNLVAAAIGALIGCPVITYEEHLRKPSLNFQPLDMDAFHKTLLVAPQQDQASQPQPTAQPAQTALALVPRPFNLFVKTLTGRTIAVPATYADRIDDIKLKIEEKLYLPPAEQRLIYGGKQLNDGKILYDLNVGPDSTLHLALKLRGGFAGMYLPPNWLDPAYDYDFTYINDIGSSFSRGGEVYRRPCGWLRFALKVDGKYGSNVWLGSSNVTGEWPVSYHGTSKHNAASIADEGYKLNKGFQFAYGRGIYSSPSVTIAEQYAKDFWTGGKRYKLIIQNRVNPATLYKVDNVDYWISPRESDIRPYGICIKEF